MTSVYLTINAGVALIVILIIGWIAIEKLLHQP